MTYREKHKAKIDKEKEESKKSLSDYEENLKLHYEACRKDLDIQLSSSMPQQINIIKTILWINLLLLGVSVQLLKEVPFLLVHLVFYIPVSISVFLMLVSLLQRRVKWYGSYENIDLAHNLYGEKYAKSDMISTMLKNVRTAYEGNRDVMRGISKYMHSALWTTLTSCIGLIVVLASQPISNQKGGDVVMADEKPKAPSQYPVNVKPTHESSERSMPKPVAKTDSNTSKN